MEEKKKGRNTEDNGHLKPAWRTFGQDFSGHLPLSCNRHLHTI